MENNECYHMLESPPKSRVAELRTGSSSQLSSLLESLRDFFSLAEKPPFAINKPFGNQGHRPGSLRKLVLATNDGKYPQAPVKRAELVYRSWNDRCMFATMELDGTLHIVKPMQGGAKYGVGSSRGAAFKHWQGPYEGFSNGPIAFEDRGPLETFTNDNQSLTSIRSTGPACEGPMQKKILRASRPLQRSANDQFGKRTDGDCDTYDQRRSYGCLTKGIVPNDTPSPSNSDEGLAGAHALETSRSSDQSVKGESSGSHSFLTPATYLPNAFRSEQDTSKSAKTQQSKLNWPVLAPDNVDKLLVQLRREGNTFKEIQNHFKETTGVSFDKSTWRRRYVRIKDEGNGKSLKRSRELSDPSDTDDYSDDYSSEETDHSDSGKVPAEGTFHTSQQARPPLPPRLPLFPQVAPKITGDRLPRQRAPASNAGVLAQKVPSLAKGVSEADKTLFHMRNFENKSWPEISQAWAAMTGKETARSTLRDRYNRLKANLIPTPPPQPKLKKLRSHQEDFTQSSGTRPSSLYLLGAGDTSSESAATERTTSSMPLLAPHKLNHTILRISHLGSFIPLKLRSCITISDLFRAVASVCDIKQTSHRKVVTLKATFSWIPENDVSRSMLLKEKFEDSFETLLETINEAPCWETENGKCTIHVEVM